VAPLRRMAAGGVPDQLVHPANRDSEPRATRDGQFLVVRVAATARETRVANHAENHPQITHVCRVRGWKLPDRPSVRLSYLQKWRKPARSVRVLLGGQEPSRGGLSARGRWKSRVYRGTDLRAGARGQRIKVDGESRMAADAKLRGRSERRARDIDKIDHPGVGDVLDQGENGGEVEDRWSSGDGGDLGGPCVTCSTRAARLHVRSARGARNRCSAPLAAAHAQWAHHRDVKTEKVVMLAPAR